MKKFQFSLQKLLSFKEQLFETERNILADMRARLADLQEQKAAMEQELKAGSAQLNQKYAEGITALEIINHKIYLDAVGQGIVQKQREIDMQQQAIDRQADKVREAKIELSTIEKLKEKKLEEYTYLENKAQEQFIEEFVSTQKAMSLLVSNSG